MRTRLLLCSILLSFAASCSEGTDAMAGNWKPDGQSGAHTVGLEFDGKGDKVMGHVDGPDGHKHPSGTYTYDAATKLVTVRAKLLGDAMADTWTGTVAGDSLELTGGTTKLKLKKGGSAH
jgi:hypothetical protein